MNGYVQRYELLEGDCIDRISYLFDYQNHSDDCVEEILKEYYEND